MGLFRALCLLLATAIFPEGSRISTFSRFAHEALKAPFAVTASPHPQAHFEGMLSVYIKKMKTDIISG
jgi:hypothetical protein